MPHPRTRADGPAPAIAAIGNLPLREHPCSTVPRSDAPPP
jgi:hypothetical protein